jgi:hypothetical protein
MQRDISLIDALTNEFAVVAVSWREVQVDTAGHSVTETGYFTGLAEYREGRWQFPDATGLQRFPPTSQLSRTCKQRITVGDYTY